MRPDPSDPQSADNRTERHATPQYQTEEDAQLADASCPTCIFVDGR